MPGAFGQPLPGDDAEPGHGAPKLPPQPSGRFRDATDPFSDPQGRAFADHVRDVTIPALDRSAFGVGIISKSSTGASFDVRQAVEIGAMLLMGKPVILGVAPGAHVPDGLARAADEIVEVDLEHDSEGSARRIRQACQRVDERRGGSAFGQDS